MRIGDGGSSGYASAFVALFLDQLTTLSQQLGSLVSAFHTDGDTQVSQANDLEPYYQGQRADLFVKAVGEYRGLTRDSLSSMEQIGGAARHFHDTVDQASQTMDAIGSGMYDGLGELVSLVFTQNLQLDDVLTSGDSAMSSAIAEAQSTLRQQLQKQQHNQPFPDPFSPFNPFPGPDPFSSSSVTSALLTWASDVQNANKTWQGVIGGLVGSEALVPTLSNNTVTVNPGDVASITNDFNTLGAATGVVTPQGEQIVDVTDAEYQQVASVYPDPRIQRYLYVLMSTPTGSKFAQYLLYMGKKVGSDFITLQHLGTGDKAPGAVTTYGGYIQLNVDVASDDATEAGYLVHEGLESYYKVGMGIREMGSQHADYVADWFAGKFWNEYNGSHYGSYGAVFSGPNNTGWINTDGSWYRDVAKEPVDTNIHNITDKGWIWKDSDTEFDFLWIHVGGTNVGNPPNPGLTPQMLTTNDMSTLDHTP